MAYAAPEVRSVRYSAVSGLLLVVGLVQPGPRSVRYDVAIVGGRIVDGSGASARRADVGIAGGRIVSLGRVRAGEAAETIEAAESVVAPGFIDVHTHADALADHPRAENFVRMGVTTVVAGNCGSSALDVGEALTRIEETGASVNFATFIGHNTVRRAVMGVENRPPSISELNRMRSFVWRAMVDGAIGFSTGLQYVPGTYARMPELIELARVAGNASGVYASHMRSEGTELERSIEETIRVGEAAGCRIQVSHLKVDSPNRWGASEKALALIDSARKRGLAVGADQYAYTAASSTLGIRFPPAALEGGHDAMVKRLSSPAMWPGIKAEMESMLAARGLRDLSFATIASYRADPALNGLAMNEAALKLRGSDSADAQFETARQMMLNGGADMVYHLMSDVDVSRIMRHPLVAIASDSGLLIPGEGTPHPRGYGNAARVLGEYVRSRKVITIEEAVRKMTSLPAEHFRFAQRGAIKPGYFADLVVLEPAAVRDTATFARPHSFPEGVSHVLVNGVPVVRNGEHTGAKPGRVLRHGASVK